MYTDSEIQVVIDQLVGTGITRPYDSLGVRNTEAVFNAIQTAAATTFLLNPEAIYFLAFLSAQKLIGDVTNLASSCQDILNSLQILRRRSLPVKDLSALENARVALFELETTTATENAPKDITKIPAYVRFNTNINRFLSRVGANIKQRGDVVPTPAEARLTVPVAVTSLLSGAAELLRLVTLLKDIDDNYRSLNLAKVVSVGVISNARKMIDTRTNSLANMNPDERLEVLRDTVLELLAAQGVVTRFGSFSNLAENRSLSGVLAPYIDSSHLGVVAEKIATPGPYTLVAGSIAETSTNVVLVCADTETPVAFLGAVTNSNSSPNTLFTRVSGSFITDGVTIGDYVYVVSGASTGNLRRVKTVAALVLTCEGPNVTVGASTIAVVHVTTTLYLPTSMFAKIETLIGEPYNIQAGVNNSLRFSINAGSDIVVTLTAGVARTATQIAADITTALTASGFKGETYYAPLKFDGVVNVSGTSISIPYGNFPLLFEIGDEVTFYFGPNAGQVRTITALIPSPSAYNTLNLSGGALVTSTATDRVQIGSITKRVRIVPTNPATSVSNFDTLNLKFTTTIERQTGITLGLYGDLLVSSSPTEALLLSDFINKNNGLITARTDYQVSYDGVGIRTEPTNTVTLVAYKAYGVGSWGAGTNITITVLNPSVETLPEVGDIVVLRGGNDIDAVGTVTSVTVVNNILTSINATFSSAVSASSDAFFEVGYPDTIGKMSVVVIDSGPNVGRYVIDSIHASIPFQFKVRIAPSIITSAFGVPVRASGSVGREALVFQSKTNTLNTRMFVLAQNTTFFSSYDTGNAIGSTPYLQAPTTDIDVGDIVDIYTTQAGTPDISSSVSEVTDTILKIGTSLPVNVSYTLGELVNSPPSAVIRKVETANFVTFKSKLKTWSATSPVSNLRAYTLELNRLLNPLLKNDNPTDSDIASAEFQIQKLLKYLTVAGATTYSLPTEQSLESILQSYVVDPEIDVTTLIKSFTERGADRAKDLLLEGQLFTFFGMDQDEASYGGYLQKTIRDVVTQDLPINKYDRLAARTSPSQVSFDSPDFEYVVEDPEETVDPPVYNPDT